MNIQNKFSSEYTENNSSHTACALVKCFQSGEKTPTEYLNDLFAHIEKVDKKLNALTSLQKETALYRAKELESIAPEHRNHPLYGVPVIIKENIQKKGYPLECASHILKGYKGQFDATVIESLENAGAIIIATANMDEFAMGSSNEHSRHGPVKNPHDITRVSGGSSGGSAAACAAGYAPVTLGSETGGSVREPAAFCGIYGFKPSYGRVSRYGLVSYASSFDQISPFARSVADIDLVLRTIAHSDPRDPTTRSDHYKSQLLRESLKNKKIGVIRNFLQKDVAENVLHKFNALEENLKKHSVTFVDVEISGLEHAMDIYYAIACAQAASNLSRFDGIRYGQRAKNTKDIFDLYYKSRSEGFGSEVKRRIMLGNFVLSAEYYDKFYLKAQAIRAYISEQFAQIFKKVDFIYLPTTPASAFHLRAHSAAPVNESLYDMFTVPANLAGLPAISLPALVTQGELPVGLQFIGAEGEDARLVSFAWALEKEKLVGVTSL